MRHSSLVLFKLNKYGMKNILAFILNYDLQFKPTTTLDFNRCKEFILRQLLESDVKVKYKYMHFSCFLGCENQATKDIITQEGNMDLWNEKIINAIKDIDVTIIISFIDYLRHANYSRSEILDIMSPSSSYKECLAGGDCVKIGKLITMIRHKNIERFCSDINDFSDIDGATGNLFCCSGYNFRDLLTEIINYEATARTRFIERIEGKQNVGNQPSTDASLQNIALNNADLDEKRLFS